MKRIRSEDLDIEITENGDVFFEGKKCSTQRGARGYRTVRVALHRLVARAFHGAPPTPQHICHHKDGNPRNNTASNLCWLTQAENTRLHYSGKPRKLTERQVSEILAKKPAQHVTLADLANSYGVSYGTVRAIRSGINWKHGYKPNNRTILTEAQVANVRAWQRPTISAAQLAHKYHVSDATIFSIWHGRY